MIFFAGAINTPQLLMLSGVGPRSHLRGLGIPVVIDLPVGDHYMNHPNIEVRTEIIEPSLRNTPVILNTNSLAELYFNKEGRLAESPNTALYFFTSNEVDSTRPNALLFANPTPNGTVLQLTMNFVGIRSYGTIRLEDSSPYTHPLIDPNFFCDPKDFKDTLDGVRFIFYLLEKSSIAQYVRAPDFEAHGCPSCDQSYKYLCTESLECYIQYNTMTTYHPSGGCRMGSVDRPDVVVDPSLRVKYAQNLRVCDASIFSIIPNANTNAPANMVAEKCAQIIKDTYHLS